MLSIYHAGEAWPDADDGEGRAAGSNVERRRGG